MILIVEFTCPWYNDTRQKLKRSETLAYSEFPLIIEEEINININVVFLNA